MRGTAAFLAARKKTLMQVMTKTMGKANHTLRAAASGSATTSPARRKSAATIVSRWSQRSTSVPATAATSRLGTAATRKTRAVARGEPVTPKTRTPSATWWMRSPKALTV